MRGCYRHPVSAGSRWWYRTSLQVVETALLISGFVLPYACIGELLPLVFLRILPVYIHFASCNILAGWVFSPPSFLFNGHLMSAINLLYRTYNDLSSIY